MVSTVVGVNEDTWSQVMKDGPVRQHRTGVLKGQEPMSTETSGTENGIERKKVITDADPKAVKRAQWEAFEFELEAPRQIRVINGSHADPTGHTYLVDVEDGVPVICGCPAFQYGDGPCKHMIAVAIRQPVIEAIAGAQTPTIPDGGETIEICRNGQEGCCGPDGDELPCFECYRGDRLRPE